MSGNGRRLGSDLAKSDAYELGPDDYGEVPELSETWIAGAKLHEGGKPVKRGRPKAANPKTAVNLRLSERVLSGFRADGPGWQTRINAVLEQWLAERDCRG